MTTESIPQSLIVTAAAHLQAHLGGAWGFARCVGRVERRVGPAVEAGPLLLEFAGPSGRVAQLSISDDGAVGSAWEV